LQSGRHDFRRAFQFLEGLGTPRCGCRVETQRVYRLSLKTDLNPQKNEKDGRKNGFNNKDTKEESRGIATLAGLAPYATPDMMVFVRNALMRFLQRQAGRTVPLLLVLPAFQVFAASGDWFAREWRTDEGLPDNDVTSLAQGPDGFLWVGTLGGLERFDGNQFEDFPTADVTRLPIQGIRTLLLDSHGRLWLNMDRGVVACVENNTSKVFSTSDGLPNSQAQIFAEDGQGGIWIGFGQRRNLARIQNGRVTTFGAAEGIPATGVGTIAADNKGQLWLVKEGKVMVFRNGQFRTLTTIADANPARVTAAKAGGIWICGSPGLRKFSEENGLEPAGQLPDGATATAMLEDHTGALWIGTAANGLFRRTDSGLEAMPASHGQIECLLEDREGNIWVGTYGGGLNRLRPRTVELLGTRDGLPFESVRSVCEDSKGQVWVTTQNWLLARQRGDGWEVVPLEPPGARANCVVSDTNGAIWIGTAESGLLRLQNGQFANWPTRNGRANDAIHGLLESSKGDLWVAYSSRLQRLRDGTLRNIILPSSAHYLRAMTEDAAGNIWAGSSDGQLFRIKDTNVVDETAHAQGGATSIRCLCGTPDGALWIGYAGSGLGRFKDGEYSRLTARQGLHNDSISQIVADKAGRLWMAGNRGIFEVPLEELSDFADGTADRVRSVVYGNAEGLPSLQANNENVPGAMCGRDGRVWMSMRTGLAEVHTASIRDNPEVPPVLVTKVTVDDHPIAAYDSHWPLQEPEARGLVDLRRHFPDLQLGASYRKLQIDFTALSFTAPENVNFRYRLEGFEDGWNELAERSATYAHLNPGNYQFHVIACNNSGVWNEKGAMLSFTVEPFLWQRLWFQVTVVSAFTLCIIAIVRYVSFRRLRRHVQQLEQQTLLHKERARIAKDIHDDLGANLTQITLLSELARQDMVAPEKAGGHLDKISSAARQVLKSMDEIVWAVNPRNDTLPHLVDYLGQFTIDFLRAPGIRCRLDLPEHPPVLNVPADIRHNLFLAVKEALNNIVKHAAAKEVRLGVNVSNGTLRVVVTDDGHGFEQTPDNAWADGLRNMRQRMGEIGGDCAIESHAGAGTTITFNVPWRN
jgi:ligand-binding sensor domain-containing protein/signal transduction histidine kinase